MQFIYEFLERITNLENEIYHILLLKIRISYTVQTEKNFLNILLYVS